LTDNLIIGMLSGTSRDGVDAVLVNFSNGSMDILHALCTPYPTAIRLTLDQLLETGARPTQEMADLLDENLAYFFARVAQDLVRETGLEMRDVSAIGSHGQNVWHQPRGENPMTIQLGRGDLIARNTGTTVVNNFRNADVMAGGQGAPLAPLLHRRLFYSDMEYRAIVNLGGIANLTWLPAGGRPDDVIAFDVGPANALIDGVVAIFSDGREAMDRDGARARRGHVDEPLLARLLEDDFLTRPPPKSTGRERYGTEESENLVRESRDQGRSEDDLVATLVAFTAESIARAQRDFIDGKVDRLLVGGGGAENPAMLDALRTAMPGVAVTAFDEVGVPAAAAEAMAFALMGRHALLGIPNHLPRCTGARHAVVLGEISHGKSIG
jgi:anhydro-N-acetylmuramic acid kinase